MNTLLSFLFAATVVCTWNGNWFPSGDSEHRKHPTVEAATIRASAEMLARGLAEVDPAGTNDLIFCFNEFRRDAVTNLVRAIGRTNLVVAAVSGYRRRDRFDYQQDVIATTLPIVSAGWEKFSNAKRETPPRGYAYAALVFSPTTTGLVYVTHLKSNYRAKDAEAVRLNRAKRTRAMTEILAREEETSKGARRPVVIAGDMNADCWADEFKDEEIFRLIDAKGYINALSLLSPDVRWTYPSRSAKYRNSALDYVFSRALKPVGLPRVVANDNLSDHNALFVVLDLATEP